MHGCLERMGVHLANYVTLAFSRVRELEYNSSMFIIIYNASSEACPLTQGNERDPNQTSRLAAHHLALF
jgi:hypothetical protein